MGKNVADIKLTANSGIELPLPNPKDVKKVLILGNTIGFFGYPGEGCNISSIHGEDAKRFAWMYNCALLGVEIEILGEEEEFDYYSDLFQKIKERYGYEAEALFTVMKGNDDYDCKLNEYIEEMEDTGKKHFDFAIMNPPYDRSLHLKFLEKVIKVADKTVNISPIAWLQFPTRDKPEFLMKHAEYFNILDRNDSNNAFGIDMGMNIAVGVFTGEEQDYQVNWYDYHPFGNRIYSIYKKITEKETPVTREMTTSPQSEYTLRLCITRRFVTECAEGRLEGSRDPKKFFTIVSRNYDTMKRKDLSGGIHFLNFNTENERDNAWNSYMTLFVRFCIAMDESVKLAPYMGDYTKPWTNERFCEYFGITGFISDTEAEPGGEWETILETMKKYA